jgi:hypothetical protein
MLVHAQWNLRRFRILEAQLMSTGVDALLDEKTAKAIDRLQRYAAANQRTYFKVLKELGAVQSNRLIRRQLHGDDKRLPELVPVAEAGKRIHLHDAAWASARLREVQAIAESPFPPALQNEPIRGLDAFREEVA